MADDEEEEFDAYTVLERAVSACDAEGIGPSLREGQRALAEVRRLRLAAQYAINVYDRYHFAASVEDFEKAANALRAELGQKAVHYAPVDNETEFERLRAENAAMFEKIMSRLDELEEKITNIRENMPGYDTDGGGYSY